MNNRLIQRDREIDQFIDQNIREMNTALEDLKSSFETQINSLDCTHY
jgi:hypothetical protein